ncbi:UDP-N-acetylglucosamine--N-acetylmuramyl-(pentapeptide) pyrophosphoryl-undecaprenol N-acetylglucosamine transferase [Planctomycetaceae bacterium]|nr:UDP-N-acetylglucosamine--N-acetylmuramyl-(pentapeptide) pyrophosphoryl-undecaprenol N-acetylglucosamine transferase [Planctomycetaceae bacterium]
MNHPRIALAGGGTGGHVAPAIALADEISARFSRDSVLFLCSGNELEREMIGARGYRFEALPISRPGTSLKSKTKTVFSLFQAVPAARKALKQMGATGVIGVGGYASLPAVLAASWLRIPIVLLEANAVPGKVTRQGSRFAKACYAHLPLTCSLDCRVDVLGNPVRRSFLDAPSKELARQALGLNPVLPTLLVIGGSQGAQALNAAMLAALPELGCYRGHFQALHITGASDTTSRAAWEKCGIAHKVVEFTHQPELFMAASDVALTRSGASTISELLALGVPQIMVPYPSAADNHQQANAEFVARAGAGIVVPESTLNVSRLCELIARYVIMSGPRENLATAARLISRPDATERILERALSDFGYSAQAPSADETLRAAA